jgi:hypothetical protein
VAGRTTWYVEIEEIEQDLDGLFDCYNLQRTHQKYGLQGRTTAAALRDALGVEERNSSLLFRSQANRTAKSPSNSRPRNRRPGGPVPGNYGIRTH